MRTLSLLLTLLFLLSSPAMEENADFWRSLLTAEAGEKQIAYIKLNIPTPCPPACRQTGLRVLAPRHSIATAGSGQPEATIDDPRKAPSPGKWC